MRLTTLAARDMNANTRLVAATEILAARFALSPGYVDEVQRQSGDPQTRMMKQREAVANLLDALVQKTEFAGDADGVRPAPPIKPLLDALETLDKIKGVGLPLRKKIGEHILDRVADLFALPTQDE